MATAALRRKKANEAELDRMAGTRLQLEMQVNTLESANLNAETMAAMKKASEALSHIHGNLCVRCIYQKRFSLTPDIACRTIDKVDATMNKVNEQRELANDIADLISTPYGNTDLDEVSIMVLYTISSSLIHRCRRMNLRRSWMSWSRMS